LAEEIAADRDLPPFNRATMDGIAIKFEALMQGVESFLIKGVQYAGNKPIETALLKDCIEIMTGAALPQTADTVVPYEDIQISNGEAIIKTNAIINQYQNIHFKGSDKKKAEILVKPDKFITPAIINTMAAVGKCTVKVKKLPAVLCISTGNELVDIYETPSSLQIRGSNGYALAAALQQYGIKADSLHLPDNQAIIEKQLAVCLKNYDVIILTGGVSMGKLDFVPAALEQLQVKKLFHKVKQRPGKPFWFGTHPAGAVVYAFPGNPVAAFICFYRYFLPWLKKSWGVEISENYAVINEDFTFNAPLQYFVPAIANINKKGILCAALLKGNGSGDFVNLLSANAFIELPLNIDTFKKGEAFKIWPFNSI
jgi:molybdopterin molybdotransferase